MCGHESGERGGGKERLPSPGLNLRALGKRTAESPATSILPVFLDVPQHRLDFHASANAVAVDNSASRQIKRAKPRPSPIPRFQGNLRPPCYLSENDAGEGNLK
ncbi:hypothetical protein SKAU_G00309890 [Synaphobranchus kaupii]|uniref:Uncharacterized protein n=1 Tax=Synaphobranchus kaupii TaxID=118154 RepID=A0A9Q1IL96_SYNKA|nr:hypothetical protein SKAU_G00309890 [Synaphobranchus kaupii]